MKNGLSSVDLRVSSHELSSVMVGARVDKVYQLKDKTLVFKLYGKSRQEFVAAANYVCLTKYKRPAPKNPSGFSMQLRKHLRGKIIQSVKKYMFERILEIKF